MVFMPWTDEFIIGIDKVDDQHRWLVDATNRLYGEATKEEPDREQVGIILLGLVDYAVTHFSVEEKLFKHHGYPESRKHKIEHDIFIVKANQLLEKHDAGIKVTNEALEFLKNWLQHHILINDKAYVPFLTEKGEIKRSAAH